MSTPRADNNEKPDKEERRLKAKTEEDAEEESLEVAGGRGGSGG